MVVIRNLRRNTQPVFFKLLVGEDEIKDEYGNPSGSPVLVFSDLMSAMLSVSPNKGNSEVEMFGTLEDYDRTAVTADTSCPIDEDAILWLDNADTDGPHNAIVKRRAPWKNSISFAIKNVKVSYAENQVQP